VKKERGNLTAGAGGVDLAIIITPMLDMAFQLLAFFIMTYHPPAREAAIDGTLKPAAQPAVSKAQKQEADPAVKMKLRIIVQAAPGGHTKSIALLKPPLTLVPVATLAKPDDPKEFAEALKKLTAALAESARDVETKDLELELDAERAVRYGYFIAVREVAEASGFKKIGFNAPR